MIQREGIRIDDAEIIRFGRFVKIARVKEEWDEFIEHPERVVDELNKVKCGADLFTFIQKFSDPKPKYEYYMEWDNVAVVQIKDFDHWWKNQISKNTRNTVRKAEKKGVVVKIIPLDEDTVKGISDIYNETPMRRGKPFPHYGKNLERIRMEHSTYPDRSCFIGAYYQGELIGFIRLIRGNGFVDVMNNVSKIQHRDKGATNALIAKAIEYCSSEQFPYLTYGNFIYGRKGMDSLSIFKRSAGFVKVDVPRYYLPLTTRGDIALRLKLHRPISEILPERIYNLLREGRNRLYAVKYGKHRTLQGGRLP
jgi:hypothetical protein